MAERPGKKQRRYAESGRRIWRWEKAGLTTDDLRYLFAGDLLGQLIATSFGLAELGVPLFGLYGACSTMGEALSLAAVMIDSGNAKYTEALASSHFASAGERVSISAGLWQPAAIFRDMDSDRLRRGCTWPERRKGAHHRITTGKIVDLGIKDTMNMGAAMAPAAADLSMQNLIDFDVTPEYYDRIDRRFGNRWSAGAD